jgi:hypothetical protein
MTMPRSEPASRFDVGGRDRFDVGDAERPRPDWQVDLIVTSPACALDKADGGRVSDPQVPEQFLEELLLRWIALFSFPGAVVPYGSVGRAMTAEVAARLGRIAWAADRDSDRVAATRAWVACERGDGTEQRA